MAEPNLGQRLRRPRTLLRLAGASVLAGFVMVWTGWTPFLLAESLVTNVFETAANAADLIVRVLEAGLMGALIVVPAWILLHVLRRLRK